MSQNKCCSFERPIHQIILKKLNEAAQLFSTLIIMLNVSWAAYYRASRDSEDRSHDAENTALHHRNKLHYKIYYNRVIFYCKNIIFIVLLYFRSNKYTLGELDLPYLILQTPNVWDIQTKKSQSLKVDVMFVVSNRFSTIFRKSWASQGKLRVSFKK